EPDLLMLDEPTNHLDLHALIWFQEYLTTYPGAILMISHDREFLNALVTGIIDIRFGKLTRYRGTYDDYVIQRKAADEQQMAAYKNQQREIAHLMEFVERFRAKASKAAQAQSKLKQVERMEKIEAPPGEESEISFNFPQPQRSGLRVVSLKGVKQAYGNNVVYENLDFECERGQRIVLVGPNGAGKSTLLKLLAGTIKPVAGEHELGHNVKSGYYSQYRVEMLQPARTVLEEALDTPQRVTEQSVRSLLGCFLFRGDDVFKHIRVLSGGEKSRLALVKLLLDPPNLLLMDEPTTHLDMASIDALIAALKQFSGTLIFISHDVYFIRGLANHVIHVNAGKLTPYSGDYQYYLDKTAATSERAALTSVQPGQTSLRAPQRQTATVKPAMDRKEQKRLEAEQRQARSQGRKDAQKKVADLEKTVAALEAKQVELTAVLESPDTYNTPGAAQQANRELANVCDELKRRTAEWEAASEKLSEMDKSAENPGA
ncbi:MAG TPA: ABC-F family ATP-binding cassette domain-containing protein, partial [Roseimicrobium sp.]|nr:ABC-F family ATP-binding cassette domain-containing protein [Roseimicrobium sp.]